MVRMATSKGMGRGIAETLVGQHVQLTDIRRDIDRGQMGSEEVLVLFDVG